MTVSSETNSYIIVFTSCGLAVMFAFLQYLIIKETKLQVITEDLETNPLVSKYSVATKLNRIYLAIREGAEAFIQAEYSICWMFVFVYGVVIFFLISWAENDCIIGAFTVTAFFLGASTSMLSGYIGMKVAVFSNVRTTINAQKEGFSACFNTAFRAGSVMGFCLCGLGISVLFSLLLLFRLYFRPSQWESMMNCVAGY